jgi:hypothetical protein
LYQKGLFATSLFIQRRFIHVGPIGVPGDVRVNKGKIVMNKIMALIFVPGIAVAGTSYDLTFRNPSQPASEPRTSRHFVQDGKVRADLAEDRVLIFKDQAMYVVDNKARTVRVDATRDQILAKIADQVRQIRAKSAAVTPDQRANMEQGASFLEDQTQTYKRTLPRDYVAYEVTIRGVHQGDLSKPLFDIPDGYQQLGVGSAHE